MQLPATAVVLVVYALAVVRVVGLIVADKLTEDARNAVVAAILPGEGPWSKARRRLAYLVTCPWCVSIYVGAAGALTWYAVGDQVWSFVAALALAFSQVTGMLADVGRGDD